MKKKSTFGVILRPLDPSELPRGHTLYQVKDLSSTSSSTNNNMQGTHRSGGGGGGKGGSGGGLTSTKKGSSHSSSSSSSSSVAHGDHSGGESVVLCESTVGLVCKTRGAQSLGRGAGTVAVHTFDCWRMARSDPLQSGGFTGLMLCLAKGHRRAAHLILERNKQVWLEIADLAAAAAVQRGGGSSLSSSFLLFEKQGSGDGGGGGGGGGGSSGESVESSEEAATAEAKLCEPKPDLSGVHTPFPTSAFLAAAAGAGAGAGRGGGGRSGDDGGGAWKWEREFCGVAPLRVAAILGFPEILQLLLDCRANPTRQLELIPQATVEEGSLL